MRTHRGGQLADRITGRASLILLDDQRQIDEYSHSLVGEILQNLDGQRVRFDWPLHGVELIVWRVVEPVTELARLKTIREARLSRLVEVEVLALGHQSGDAFDSLYWGRERGERE